LADRWKGNTVEEVIKAERQTVRFFDGLEVDGYRLPDGEFRVGLTGASLVLGYAKNWLGRVLSRGGNAVKALRGYGFTEKVEKVVTRLLLALGSLYSFHLSIALPQLSGLWFTTTALLRDCYLFPP
jgi:hypothetical protein